MCVTYDYVISFNMLTRRAVQNVLNALLEQECSYWKDHRQEWIRLCLDPAVLWDGYHWQFVRCLVQAKLWWDLINHIKGMRETHLRDQILILIKLNSPRLYQRLWGEHEDIVESQKKRKSQKGGARFRRKPFLIVTIHCFFLSICSYDIAPGFLFFSRCPLPCWRFLKKEQLRVKVTTCNIKALSQV